MFAKKSGLFQRAFALVCCTIVVTALSSGTSLGAPVTFSNEALFLGSVGPQTLESFEDETATNNTGQTFSLPLSDFTLSSDDAFGVFDSPAFGQSASDGRQFIGSLNFGTTTLTFDDPVSTFGINILDFGDSGTGMLTFSNGTDSFTAAVSQSNANLQFFGIISDFAFTTVTLSHAISGESYGIDEIYYGLVPEPASVSLLILAAGACLTVRRMA